MVSLCSIHLFIVNCRTSNSVRFYYGPSFDVIFLAHFDARLFDDEIIHICM